MEERRKYKRIGIDIDVEHHISKRQEWLRGNMINLGAGGICLISNHGYGVANLVDLRFIIPENKNKIEVAGIVKWENFDMDSNLYIAGIQFEHINENDRAFIEKFIEHETFKIKDHKPA